MAFELRSLDSFERLSPVVKLSLQAHLLNCKAPEPELCVLGTFEQLKVAARISSSEQLNNCFDVDDGVPNVYPDLKQREYLVACVKERERINVVAVYTLTQMRQMVGIHSQPDASIEWQVLSISKTLETELLVAADTRSIDTRKFLSPWTRMKYNINIWEMGKFISDWTRMKYNM